MSEETPGVPEVSVTAAVPASPLTTIANLGKHEGASVTLHAWLYNLRASGKLLFPIFRDGLMQPFVSILCREFALKGNSHPATPISPIRWS